MGRRRPPGQGDGSPVWAATVRGSMAVDADLRGRFTTHRVITYGSPVARSAFHDEVSVLGTEHRSEHVR